MNCPKAVMFDVDDTLAESFQPPTARMLEKISSLLEHVPVAIITGAGFARLDTDFLLPLSQSPYISRLYVLPNSSAQAYVWAGGWNEEYSHALTEEERGRIKSVLEKAAGEVPLIRDTQHYGERISDREAQVAFTVVGLDAPQDYKMSWDPDAAKRRVIREYLLAHLPEFDIRTGGASTIDVTRKDVSKAYGVQWLAQRLKIEPSEMFYVGDALYEGGNDSTVIPTGIQTFSVHSPADTEVIIDELLSTCGKVQST